MVLADFHMHSTFSDGSLSIPELVDFYGSRGFGAIAVTDHLCDDDSFLGRAARLIGRSLTPATFPIYQAILKSEAERAWKEYRMVLIPGFEITKNKIANSRSAHLLALGCTEWISANPDVTEIIEAIHRQNGLAVAAHPVSTGKAEKQTHYLWDRRHELSTLMDAWEVASGPVLFDQVLKSGLPLLANSDLHRTSQIHSWKTVLECERTPDAILNAIRLQNLSFQFYSEFNPSEKSHGKPRIGIRSDLANRVRPPLRWHTSSEYPPNFPSTSPGRAIPPVPGFDFKAT